MKFVSRLLDKYKNEIKNTLKDEMKTNDMLIPKIDKITISVGAGFAMKDTKLMQNICDTISLIAGQKAMIVKARKSVASFKVREGMNIGVKVTLRGQNMYNFLDKLCSVALPRVKDFKGLSVNGFDGNGNYNFGLDEQLIFPEVKYDDIIRTHGMNLTINTSSVNDKDAYRLLELIGLPFEKRRA